MSGPRIALDHNFPRPIVATLGEWTPHVEITAIDAIDPMYATLPDWKLLVALHRAKFDALVTNDDDFVRRPRELVTLEQTHDLLGRIASRNHSTIGEIRRRYRLSHRQLDVDPLEQIEIDD